MKSTIKTLLICMAALIILIGFRQGSNTNTTNTADADTKTAIVSVASQNSSINDIIERTGNAGS